MAEISDKVTCDGECDERTNSIALDEDIKEYWIELDKLNGRASISDSDGRDGHTKEQTKVE